MMLADQKCSQNRGAGGAEAENRTDLSFHKGLFEGVGSFQDRVIGIWRREKWVLTGCLKRGHVVIPTIGKGARMYPRLRCSPADCSAPSFLPQVEGVSAMNKAFVCTVLGLVSKAAMKTKQTMNKMLHKYFPERNILNFAFSTKHTISYRHPPHRLQISISSLLKSTPGLISSFCRQVIWTQLFSSWPREINRLTRSSKSAGSEMGWEDLIAASCRCSQIHGKL